MVPLARSSVMRRHGDCGEDGVVATENSARPLLIPAVRFRKIDFKERPFATPDTNASYLNTRDYLAGILLSDICED